MELDKLEGDALARIGAAADLAALEALRIEYLGKQGSVSALLKTLGGMEPEERQEKAPRIQGLRQAVSDASASAAPLLRATCLLARCESPAAAARRPRRSAGPLPGQLRVA